MGFTDGDQRARGEDPLRSLRRGQGRQVQLKIYITKSWKTMIVSVFSPKNLREKLFCKKTIWLYFVGKGDKSMRK
jgi:hypothetical protein